jgi:hypothetical protein
MKTTIRSLLFWMAFFSVGLLPAAQAVVPAPDGGYPGGNTAEGQNALFSLTTGGFNTAVGFLSLSSVTTGSFSTAVGAGALLANTADQNTATGAGALLSDTNGDRNTANGAFALFSNTTGANNTAIGVNALNRNIDGDRNTAVGAQALRDSEGNNNTATGFQALRDNTTGFSNTANGDSALVVNSGSNNTAIGAAAGLSLTTGSGNVCIGTAVGGVAGESNRTRIRNIGSTAIGGGINVVISGTGGIGDQVLGYASSSRRYKEEIKPMEKASETLFALKPVTFRAKGNINPAHVKHYGLIAEDVAAVDSDLVVYNPEGKPETLRFDSINAMLLNEFLKEHSKVQELEAALEAVTARLKEQDAKIDRVSEHLESSKPAPQLASNDQR